VGWRWGAVNRPARRRNNLGKREAVRAQKHQFVEEIYYCGRFHDCFKSGRAGVYPMLDVDCGGFGAAPRGPGRRKRQFWGGFMGTPTFDAPRLAVHRTIRLALRPRGRTSRLKFVFRNIRETGRTGFLEDLLPTAGTFYISPRDRSSRLRTKTRRPLREAFACAISIKQMRFKPPRNRPLPKQNSAIHGGWKSA